MAITFLEREKIQRYLILVFLAIVLITIFLIWYNFLRKQEFIIVEPEEILILPKKIEIDFGILKSPILEELKPFEEIPPLEEKIGRENPFIPY